MSIREVLTEFSEQTSLILKKPHPPSQLKKESTRLLSRIERAGEARDQFDRGALVFKLRQISDRRSWSLLSREELRRSILVLAEGQPPLQEDRRIFKGILREVQKREGAAMCNALVAHYLRHFDSGSRSTRDIAKLLASEVRSRPGLERWKRRNEAYRLFDTRVVTSTLAKEIVGGKESDSLFHDAGIRGDAVTSGIGRFCFIEGCGRVRSLLSRQKDANLARGLMKWARSPDGKLRYPLERGPLAEALLLPWADREPSDPQLQGDIESFLDQTYGDPRFDQSRWSGVSEAAKAVRFRWLARRSLRLFLDVVGEATDRPDQWHYRRAFWEAYMNRGHVPHAWVAFAVGGQAIVNKMIRDSRDVRENLRGSFAQLQSAASSHAVLVMRVANLLIADWSHNGSLRIWREGHANAPELYKSIYRGPNLRTQCHKTFRHFPVEGTNCWQNQAHDYIEQWTGIEIPSYEYMP